MEPTPADDREELLLAEAVALLESSGDGALESFLSFHTDEAPRLRERLGRLRRLDLLAPPASGAVPERLGGFHLLRVLGGGGMGVVYEAEQEALGRRVALKVIRPELHFFERSRARFRREIEAAARLSHPGIVPIHEVGDQAGLPYFTMELVRGCSLAEVVDELRGRAPGELSGTDLQAVVQRRLDPGTGDSSAAEAAFRSGWCETVLRLLRQVAEALEHAHGRGVVHRDVKPSNVLVTETGRALLVDFGLALPAEAEPLTKSGAQPGSLPYMSPEQLGDRAVDARTDVYSLGVTLYELLTLRAAFGGSAEEVRRRILAGDTPRARQVEPSVPRDLETVCSTAMDPDPERRYQTAGDLARDLTNLLARRPIEARRAGFALRAVRWGQRHPRLAAAALAILPLLAAGAGLAAAREQHHADLLRRERDLARARADELRDLATSFVLDFHDSIVNLAGATEARRLVVVRARKLLDELRAEGDPDPALARALASANLRLADVLGGSAANLGDPASALQHYAQARALVAELEALGEATPEDLNLARSADQMQGELLTISGRPEEGLACAERARETARRLAVEHPGSELLELGELESTLFLASLLADRGELPRSSELVSGLLERTRGVLARRPGDSGATRILCQALLHRGSYLAIRSDSRGSLACYEEMRDLAAGLVEREPESGPGRRLLSQGLEGTALQLQRLGRFPESLAASRRALTELERLLDADPADMEARSDLMRLLGRLGDALLRSGDAQGSLEPFRRAAEVGAALAASGRAPKARVMRVLLETKLAQSLVDLELQDEAGQHLELAGELAGRLLAENPGSEQVLQAAYMVEHLRAQVLAERGELEAAIESRRSSVGLVQRLLELDPDSTPARANLALAESDLADLEAAAGRGTDAAASHGRAVATFRALLADDPESGRALDSLCYVLLRRANCLEGLERPLEARPDFAEAARLAERLLDLSGANLTAQGYRDEALAGLERTAPAR